MNNEISINNIIGFQWDEGNTNKNLIKHSVTTLECEQVFFNKPIMLENDIKHSKSEKRYYVLGKTDGDRKLFIAFTIRNNLVRIISARDMHRKEKIVYEYEEKNTDI